MRDTLYFSTATTGFDANAYSRAPFTYSLKTGAFNGDPTSARG
jgi:hypothetical protein